MFLCGSAVVLIENLLFSSLGTARIRTLLESLQRFSSPNLLNSLTKAPRRARLGTPCLVNGLYKPFRLTKAQKAKLPFNRVRVADVGLSLLNQFVFFMCRAYPQTKFLLYREIRSIIFFLLWRDYLHQSSFLERSLSSLSSF